MKDFIVTSFLLLSLVSVTNAQNNLQYQLFNNDEEIANYDGMIKDLVVSDMVFGEYHDNPISHWMQLEMSKSFLRLKVVNYFSGPRCLNLVTS
jgi:D-mannonate dehydratase